MTEREQHPDPERLGRVVDDIVKEMVAIPEWGEVSNYLPGLAQVDVHQFGLTIVTCDGDIVAGGDADQFFTLQSISKVFALMLALERFGEEVWHRVGREPSGDPYNSIIDLERHKGIPRNPFINPGALVITDMLLENSKGDTVPEFVRDRLIQLVGDDQLGVDESLWSSERTSSFTNRALANLAKSFGNLHHEVENVIAAYVRQCAISLSCRQLAKAGRYLMVERAEADSAEAIREEARRSRRVASLMLTCGQYDGSGDFAFRVGLPAKSGIGGGILAIVPSIASVAVWSPGLDDNGNSLLGTLALERLSERMDWSVFGAANQESH